MSKMTQDIVTVKPEVRMEEWKQQVAACMNSGMSIRRWCEQEGVAVGTYYNRLRKVRELVLEQEIVPVQMKDNAQIAEKIEITTEQMKISLPADVNGNTLALVLQTIQAC